MKQYDSVLLRDILWVKYDIRDVSRFQYDHESLRIFFYSCCVIAPTLLLKFALRYVFEPACFKKIFQAHKRGLLRMAFFLGSKILVKSKV